MDGPSPSRADAANTMMSLVSSGSVVPPQSQSPVMSQQLPDDSLFGDGGHLADDDGDTLPLVRTQQLIVPPRGVDAEDSDSDDPLSGGFKRPRKASHALSLSQSSFGRELQRVPTATAATAAGGPPPAMIVNVLPTQSLYAPPPLHSAVPYGQGAYSERRRGRNAGPVAPAPVRAAPGGPVSLPMSTIPPPPGNPGDGSLFHAVPDEDSGEQRSLGALCDNFLAEYGSGHMDVVSLDEAATRLRVERRRIYDIVNILESLDVVRRKAKNKYWWVGTSQLVPTLTRLQHKAVRIQADRIKAHGVAPKVPHCVPIATPPFVYKGEAVFPMAEPCPPMAATYQAPPSAYAPSSSAATAAHRGSKYDMGRTGARSGSGAGSGAGAGAGYGAGAAAAAAGRGVGTSVLPLARVSSVESDVGSLGFGAAFEPPMLTPSASVDPVARLQRQASTTPMRRNGSTAPLPVSPAALPPGAVASGTIPLRSSPGGPVRTRRSPYRIRLPTASASRPTALELKKASSIGAGAGAGAGAGSNGHSASLMHTAGALLAAAQAAEHHDNQAEAAEAAALHYINHAPLDDLCTQTNVSTDIIVADDLSQHSRRAKSVPRRERSLGALCQRFLSIFLLGRRAFCLDDAARILMLPGEECTNSKLRTKVRRLYDIANVLCTVRLIAKVLFPNSRKPGFVWLGPAFVPVLPGVHLEIRPASDTDDSDEEGSTAAAPAARSRSRAASRGRKSATKSDAADTKGKRARKA